MNKTVAALDELLSSVITLIPTWINMFKSTRFLTLLGTGVVMYITWKYGGLTDGQLLVVQAAETILGGTFMVTKTLRPSTPAAPVFPALNQVASGVDQRAGEAIPPPQATPALPVIQLPAPPWDAAAFDAQVKKKAAAKYGVDNASTELSAAMDIGQDTPTDYIEHVQAYWDYATMKADARFTEVWGYSYPEAELKVREPGCPNNKTTCGNWSNLKHKALSLGEGFYASYLDYERIQRKANDVNKLAALVAKGFNWREYLPWNRQTLYWTGELASELTINIS
jgi:hypothetical protein